MAGRDCDKRSQCEVAYPGTCHGARRSTGSGCRHRSASSIATLKTCTSATAFAPGSKRTRYRRPALWARQAKVLRSGAHVAPPAGALAHGLARALHLWRRLLHLLGRLPGGLLHLRTPGARLLLYAPAFCTSETGWWGQNGPQHISAGADLGSGLLDLLGDLVGGLLGLACGLLGLAAERCRGAGTILHEQGPPVRDGQRGYKDQPVHRMLYNCLPTDGPLYICACSMTCM